MTDQRMRPHEHRPHQVYVLRSNDDQILYVGCSVDVDKRIKSHLRDQPWRAEIDPARTVRLDPMSWEEARAVEEAAIKEWEPRHNKHQRNGTRLASMGVRRTIVEERRLNDAVRRGEPGAVEAREAWEAEQVRRVQEAMREAMNSTFGQLLTDVLNPERAAS